MRHFLTCIGLLATVTAVSGCSPQAFGPDGASDPLNAILSATADPSASADASPSSDHAPDPNNAAPPPAGVSRDFSDSLGPDRDYRLFELGSGRTGDAWSVSLGGVFSGPFVVVLLDADQDLLMRTYMSFTKPLQHVLREDTDQLYLGIMSPIGGPGGGFRMNATLETGQSVPAPAPQVVWVNFGGGQNVRVHRRDPISFAPFNGAMIDEAYAGHTQEMKNVILQEMRADYASYNILILSSDDQPPPTGPHSTVHFGGDEAGLLGLADNVDDYNQNLTQNAVVYIENFAPYWTMQLTPDEMAVMVANVASHEVGHLLGLYHTKDPDDLMDTTGSAWDLAENQSFIRGPLEDSVFATGWEDSPTLLGHILGWKPDETAKSAARQKSPKAATYKAIRRFARHELRYACGTCLSLDRE
jgi:hypothetical protein